jgi:hypothetical protein
MQSMQAGEPATGVALDITRSVPTAGAPAGEGMGRVIAVSGGHCTVALDLARMQHGVRAQMGALLAIETAGSTALAVVSSLSVPKSSAASATSELWLAELGLVGEIRPGRAGGEPYFARGVSAYPSLGDSVRPATHAELERAFVGRSANSIRIGHVLQDDTIPALVDIDDMLGKHFAVLGTTGTGKSCTTALLLREVLNKNKQAHIVLLDPHNEYATAFRDCAEVISQGNMQLPYWLLTFEELIEVLMGAHRRERRQEIEILQDLIPLAKARYGRGASQQGLRRAGPDARMTVDTPLPYRLSELIALIDERMGRLDNKRDLTPYRNLRTRFDALMQDPRYAFMFGSLTVYDSMAQILGRLFRVPTNGRPITIFELTGVPTEITAVVVTVVCRLAFDFAVWSEGRVPITVVCEEAHRYVPAQETDAFEPCRRAIARIAKEGRKYGCSLCIVTQRPAEIDPTILSQCNTVFALRLSNDRDQDIVRSAIADTGSGLLEFLSALGPREAIAFGDGVAMPVRVRFDDLAPEFLPRSASVSFSELWQSPVGSMDYLDGLVERWRAASATASDASRDLTAFVDALDVPTFEPQVPNPIEERLARGRDTGTERREYGALRRKPPAPPAGAPPNVSVQPAGGLADDMDRLLGRRT